MPDDREMKIVAEEVPEDAPTDDQEKESTEITDDGADVSPEELEPHEDDPPEEEVEESDHDEVRDG